MARASTTLLNGITATAAAQYKANPTEVDLALATTSLGFSAKVVTGTVAPIQKAITVHYAFSLTQLVAGEVTAAMIPDLLDAEKKTFFVTPSDAASTERNYVVDSVPFASRYIYVWHSHPALGQPVTLTVNAITS